MQYRIDFYSDGELTEQEQEKNHQLTWFFLELQNTIISNKKTWNIYVVKKIKNETECRKWKIKKLL